MGYKERLQQQIWDIPASTIAYRLGVHVNTVHNWQHGLTDMRLGQFVALVKAFRLDVNYIINGKEGAPHGIEYR